VPVFHPEQGLHWEFCIWIWTPVSKPCYQSDCSNHSVTGIWTQ